MAIRVHFFASLRERLGRAEAQVDAARAQTVAQVWREATGETELPPNTLCALNQNHTQPEAAVAEGDEVGFFPPVTGG